LFQLITASSQCVDYHSIEQVRPTKVLKKVKGLLLFNKLSDIVTAMVVSERALKWGLCLYPPLFFQRIWVRKFHKGFRGVDVKISKSLFNRNYNGSIFGGTIYSATDPFYAILFDQLLQRRGFKVRVWLKSASIQYLKPGRSHLYFTISITDEVLADAIAALSNHGKYIKAFPMEIRSAAGEICASVINEVYIRNLHQGEGSKVAY
jgi:hypothetical protein